MKLLTVLLLASIALCSGYQFSGNFSAKEIQANKWSYKFTAANGVNVPGLWLGGTFVAGSSEGNLLVGSVDIVAGSGYVVLGNYPFCYLAYFQKDYNITLSGEGFASADVSKSAGYMGHASLWLEERNSNNQIVGGKSLMWLPNIGLNNAGLTYTLSETSKMQDDIQFVTFSGTSNDESTPNFNVEITYLATRRAGIVSGEGIENIPLVPGSIESILRINNYPYQNPNNTISLVMVVATGAVAISASGQTLYSGDKEVYFSLAKVAYVGGKKTNVGISAFEVGNFSVVANDNFATQVKGKYGVAAEAKFVRVTFPAGASSIVYDPAIGTGESAVEAGSNGAGSVAISVFLVVFMLVSTLL